MLEQAEYARLLGFLSGLRQTRWAAEAIVSTPSACEHKETLMSDQADARGPGAPRQPASSRRSSRPARVARPDSGAHGRAARADTSGIADQLAALYREPDEEPRRTYVDEDDLYDDDGELTPEGGAGASSTSASTSA